MNPFSSSHGTIHSQQKFPAQWSTNTPYSPPFSPAFSHNTTPAHADSPPIVVYAQSSASPTRKQKRGNDENSAPPSAFSHISPNLGNCLVCINTLDTSISCLEKTLAGLSDEREELLAKVPKEAQPSKKRAYTPRKALAFWRHQVYLS